MKNKIYNYYVISARFDGQGKGFALGFNNQLSAMLFCNYVCMGFASIVPDYYLEEFYPQYYHNLVAKTDKPC